MQSYTISRYRESVKVDNLKRSLKPPETGTRERSVHTLAQPGTNPQECACGDHRHEHDFEVSAQTSAADLATLKKRARRKYLTDGYIGALADASKLNENSRLQKSYWNTFHCSRTLTLQSDGKISGRYCKNRWCLVCNSIRTAQLIRRYGPTLESWEDKHFVTLTIPNVEAASLPAAIEAMGKTFLRCKERLKKRSQRGQCPAFEGLRKMECTYNHERNDFHPHYHAVASTQEAANQLREVWMETWNSSFEAAIWGEAVPAAQDVRPATQSATLELFKYFAKVVQGKGKQDRYIYADALDIIFNAVKGTRVFQPFGFSAPPLTEEEKAEGEEEGQAWAVLEYTWDRETSDWKADETVVDGETAEVIEEGQPLSGYVPGDALRDLVENKVVIRPGHSWERYSKPVRIFVQGGQPVCEEEEAEARRYLDSGRRIMSSRHERERKKELGRRKLQMSLAYE